MNITTEQLKHICPRQSTKVLDKYTPYLNKYFIKYEINTLLRIQHFLAQIAVESEEFVYTKECASGRAYEGRKDLGNINSGDGVKFKGRGLIQITGRLNYIAISKFIFNDERLLDHPELLETPEYATVSAI